MSLNCDLFETVDRRATREEIINFWADLSELARHKFDKSKKMNYRKFDNARNEVKVKAV
jgi:hypothetical protein